MNRRKAFISIALVAACAGSATALSHATAPARNGRIAFQRYRLIDKPLWPEIFVANVDGTDVRKVTHAPRGSQDGDPDWAPDGSRIAFERCSATGPCAILSVRPSGGAPRRLSPFCPRGSKPPKCVADESPAYSPDGRHIAYFRFRSGTSLGLMVGDTRLRHVRRIGLGTEPGWSPDGKRLVFVRINDPGTGRKPVNGRALFLVNADGRGLHRLTPWRLHAGDDPDWSPDGTRILFRSVLDPDPDFRGNLFTIRPDGTGLRQLTHFHGEAKVLNGSYSPDGESIVFSTAVGAANPTGADLPDVFVMGADGADIRPVTRARNWDGSPDWGTR